MQLQEKRFHYVRYELHTICRWITRRLPCNDWSWRQWTAGQAGREQGDKCHFQSDQDFLRWVCTSMLWWTILCSLWIALEEVYRLVRLPSCRSLGHLDRRGIDQQVCSWLLGSLLGRSRRQNWQDSREDWKSVARRDTMLRSRTDAWLQLLELPIPYLAQLEGYQST